MLSNLSRIFTNKFSKDTLVTLLSQGIIGISGLVINVIIGNHYNPEGLGVYHLSMSYFLITSLITNLGIPISVLKYSSEHINNNSEQKSILSSSIILNIVVSIIGVLIVYLFLTFWGSSLFSDEVVKSINYSLLSIPFFAINKNYLAVLNGERRMYEYSFLQGFRWIFIIFCIYLFVLFEVEVYYLTLSLFFSEIIIFIICTLKFRSYFCLNFDKSYYKLHFIFGLKSFLPTVIYQFGQSISVIMVGYFLGNHETGIYSFASTIALGIVFLPTVIQTNFNPIISNLSANKQFEQLQAYMYKIRSVVFKLILPLNLSLVLLFPIGVSIFMHDKDYSQTYLPFYLMMIGISFYSLFNWASGMLSMLGLLKENLMRVSISMGINVVLNIILIPVIGVEGAAIALSVSYLFQLFLLRYYLKRKMNLILF